MRVIALSTLREFWTGKAAHADAREPTLAWARAAVLAHLAAEEGIGGRAVRRGALIE